MQSQNVGGIEGRSEARSDARTLREHLSQFMNTKQRELDRKLGNRPTSSTSTSRDELVAEVSLEAADLDFERWDGLS
jgi:hypothetical protein